MTGTRRDGRAAPGSPIEERGFHRWLARHLPAGRQGLLPIGDDTAAIRPPPGRAVALTTDAMVEGTHFLPASPPYRVGAAVAAVNLSDLAAKGADPAALLLALVVPRGTDRSWATRVVRGAERVSERYGALLVGGDTKPGPVRAVAGFAVGWGRPGSLAPRSGARPGDVLATTGVVGRGGLAARRLAAARRGDRSALTGLLDVRPRVVEGRILAPVAHAMIDTSDGLAEAAHLLAEASRRRLVVDDTRVPWAAGIRRLRRSGARRWRSVAFFGGDYELLAALPGNRFERTRRAVEQTGVRLTAIGRVERGRGAWLVLRGRETPLPRAGWQPFGRGGRRPS